MKCLQTLLSFFTVFLHLPVTVPLDSFTFSLLSTTNSLQNSPTASNLYPYNVSSLLYTATRVILLKHKSDPFSSSTYSENGEVVGPPGKMKEGRLNAGQAETTGVHCISQHTQQSHTSLPWPLFFHCLKCSSTVILLTNAYVAFKSQITRHLLLATFFVHKITPSMEPFLCLIPISIIIRLNWIF